MKRGINLILETKRLILRQFNENDAENLYKYAKDPEIGPLAGWLPHKNVDESKRVIKEILSKPETYAICLKTDSKAIGAIDLKLKGQTDMTTAKEDECELGYWLGKPFWGQGIVPEAAKEMIRHAFEDLSMNAIWCGYYDGNIKSKRVQEKLGFEYVRTTKNLDVPLLGEKRTGHSSILTKEHWEQLKKCKLI